MAVDVDSALPGVDVRWRDRDWRAAPGVPLAALTLAQGVEDFDPNTADHAAILVAGLFEVEVDDIRALNPTREELWFILRKVAEEVRTSVGESPASSEPSGK